MSMCTTLCATRSPGPAPTLDSQLGCGVARAARLTEVLDGLDVVVAQVEGVQLLEWLQVLNLVQQVHL